MHGSKRSSFSSKSGKFNGKLKEILSLTRPKSETRVADIKDFSNIPILKQSENATVLRKYTEVLSRNGDEGVSMDDLDQLQQDLEKLLCTNAVRTRFLLGGYTQTEPRDVIHEKKAHDKTSLKRKRPDEKPRAKDVKNGLRIVKKDPSRGYNDNTYQEIPKIALPRNDNSDKFWSSIEPYCAQVNKDDVVFLDTLIQEFSNDIDVRIPDIGEHYANGWTEELINEEQNLGKSPTKKPAISDFKKTSLHSVVESFGNSFCQKLLPITDKSNIKLLMRNSEHLSNVKHASQKVGMCLDKRLAQELVNQGILTREDLDKNFPEDEILSEIKKCKQELITVNEYNLDELNKLRSAVMNDIHCNELKDDLDKIDKEVLDLYNNIMVTRKKALQDEGKDYDAIFSQTTITDFERKANALLRQQHVLNREINSMTDMSMLY